MLLVQTIPSLQYAKASSMLSFSSIRQQFSCLENIQMSLYSIQFLKSINRYLHVDGSEDGNLDIGFVEGGYLFLAPEKGEVITRENYALQR